PANVDTGRNQRARANEAPLKPSFHGRASAANGPSKTDSHQGAIKPASADKDSKETVETTADVQDSAHQGPSDATPVDVTMLTVDTTSGPATEAGDALKPAAIPTPESVMAETAHVATADAQQAAAVSTAAVAS